MHDLELATIVLALQTWWHYLLRNVVHIYTDHNSFKKISTQADLNMRQRTCAREDGWNYSRTMIWRFIITLERRMWL
jgi:hypothetical protein